MSPEHARKFCGAIALANAPVGLSTAIPPTRAATFIGGPQYQKRMYAASHPLAIPRVSLTYDLIQAYAAFTPGEYETARIAEDHELLWFHTGDYIKAMQDVQRSRGVGQEQRKQYKLGTLENPYFEDMFDIAATATGASIQAAEIVLQGRIAFNPAGGMHHARAGHAQGFCYFNDPVLAIKRLRQEGLRVLYADIDAHHGDGVELAFADDGNVLTISLHMDTRYAYPHQGGQFSDAGSAKNGYATVNLPLPKGTHDAEYKFIFQAIWEPLLEKFKPDVVVLQAGTDILSADPLGRFTISTQCFLSICEKVLQDSPRLLVTGGGGYHPLVLARAWTGLWGVLSGRNLPVAMPPQGAKVLQDVAWDLDEDEPYFSQLFLSRLDTQTALPIREEITTLVKALPSHPYFRKL